MRWKTGANRNKQGNEREGNKSQVVTLHAYTYPCGLSVVMIGFRPSFLRFLLMAVELPFALLALVVACWAAAAAGSFCCCAPFIVLTSGYLEIREREQ